MRDHQIGQAFMIGLGLISMSYGVSQLVQAYRAESLGEWAEKVLLGTVGIVVGFFLALGGYWLKSYV